MYFSIFDIPLDPPSSVRIHGQDHAKEGTILNLECVSAPSYPPAQIYWKVFIGDQVKIER